MTHITIEKAKLEQWLEALEKCRDGFEFTRQYVGYETLPAIDGWSWYDGDTAALKSIDAIKAALAKPAQEPDHGDELTIAYMSGVHRGKELAAQPAPVQGDITEILDRFEVFVGGLGKAILREVRIALAAQRPWVGLVNKDKVLDFGDAHVTTEFARGALWAEAKLKELNT